MRVEHLGVLYRPIVVPSQLLNADLPIVKLPQQLVDIVIERSNFVLGPGSILYLFHFFDDVGSDLLAPLLALVDIRNLSDVANALGTLVVLFVDQGAFHRPPSVQHTLSFFAVTGH